MKKNELSVVINTKNEEKNISDCVESVKNIASEIIVCDMQSTDNTIKIAKSLGAKVISVKDYGYVEPAKMKAIKAAKFDWILIIDADERMGGVLQNKIKNYLLSPKYNIVAFSRKNLMLGFWIKNGLRWPDYQVRLFKKGSVRFSKTIHSQPILIEEVYKLPPKEEFSILHYHSRNTEQLLMKTWQQAKNENFYQNQQTITPELIRERIAHEIDWRFIEHKGFKDGIPGYISAKFMEFYRFLEFVDYWEENKELNFTKNQAKNLVKKKDEKLVFSNIYKKIKDLF